MKIVIAGGSGLIGQELSRALVGQGHEVWVLSRDPAQAKLPAGVQAEAWDGKTAQGWGRLASEADALINLAGANIGARPWTNARKGLILSSRVQAGQAIVSAIRESAPKPRVVLQIAGTGYYGYQRDRPLDENAPAGNDYLAKVGMEWEGAIQPVTAFGARLVVMRTGVVLTPTEGVLAPFILQNRLFVGGPLGSGRQWVSWIHICDLVRAFTFLLERSDAEGVFNVSAPQPLSNADFAKTVSRTMGRPYWLPVPAFALKLLLGEMSNLVLEGQRVEPVRLLAMGYRFEYDTLQKALEDLLKQG